VPERIAAADHLSRPHTGPILDVEGMDLSELLTGLDVLGVSGNPAAKVTSVAYDSRQVKPGTMFVAIAGEKTDGNRFVFDAVARGAAAVASELPRPWDARWATIGVAPADLPASVSWVQVRQARRALAVISANYFGRPAQALKLIGITGTNGKTTTAYLVDSILRAAGYRTGLLGTVEYRLPNSSQPAKHTTPESLELQGFLAGAREAGGSHVVFEVSSHALAMDRVWGCPFEAAVFTNLTRDHLDFHKDFDDYFAAKRRLFEGTGGGAPGLGVINVDDPRGRELLGLARRRITYGLNNGADLTAKRFALSFSGLEFTAQTPAGKLDVRSRLVGRINVYNILAALGVGVGLGLPVAALEAGVRQLESVPGRFERIDEGQPFLVVVDYAHTDDALRNLLQTARELLKNGRLITVFGCGGDRDRAKRPLMGEAAGRLSNFVVLTSDNPRSEDPRRIINDILVGLQRTDAPYSVEPDRARAIALALDEARAGDVVLLAGKGHETYQVLADRTIDFDDRQVARRELARRGYAKS